MTITKDAKLDAAGTTTDTDHELLRQLEAQVRRAPIVLLNDGRVILRDAYNPDVHGPEPTSADCSLFEAWAHRGLHRRHQHYFAFHRSDWR